MASIYCTPHAASSSISFRRIVSAIRLAAPFHFSASWPTWVLAVLVSQLDYMGGLVANALLFAEPVHLDCELFQIRVRTEWTEGTRQPVRCKARPSSKSWAERREGRSLGTGETAPRCEPAQESPALKSRCCGNQCLQIFVRRKPGPIQTITNCGHRAMRAVSFCEVAAFSLQRISWPQSIN